MKKIFQKFTLWLFKDRIERQIQDEFKRLFDDRYPKSLMRTDNVQLVPLSVYNQLIKYLPEPAEFIHATKSDMERPLTAKVFVEEINDWVDLTVHRYRCVVSKIFEKRPYYFNGMMYSAVIEARSRNTGQNFALTFGLFCKVIDGDGAEITTPYWKMDANIISDRNYATIVGCVKAFNEFRNSL